MDNTQDKLTDTQIMFLVISSIFGVTGLLLPRMAVEVAGVDSIITIIITGIISLMLLRVMVKLSSKYPNKIIIEYARDILGSSLGNIYAFIFTIYLLSISGIVLRIFADTIKGIILPETPLEVIMITMLFTSMYLMLNGISSLSKVCEIFMPIMILVSLILIFLPLKKFNIEEIYPIFSMGIKPVLKGIPKIFSAFIGLEIVLFITPFAKDANNILRYSTVGLLIPTCLYTLLVSMTIGIFGVATTKFSLYPTLEIARSINFPGAFAERFDIFFMFFWVLASFSTLSCYFYMTALSVAKLAKLNYYKPFALIIAPLIFLIAIVFPNLQEIFIYSQYIGYLGISILFSNVILYIVYLMRKRRHIQ